MRAPIDGVVVQQHVALGQRVQVGALLLTLVPVDHVYVNANFKESQLKNVRIGKLD